MENIVNRGKTYKNYNFLQKYDDNFMIEEGNLINLLQNIKNFYLIEMIQKITLMSIKLPSHSLRKILKINIKKMNIIYKKRINFLKKMIKL